MHEAKTHSIVSDQDAEDAESTARQNFKRRIYAWDAFSRTLSRREFFF